eukprot:scaffold1679_cov127-Isochrysis_galbana.AAC.7
MPRCSPPTSACLARSRRALVWDGRPLHAAALAVQLITDLTIALLHTNPESQIGRDRPKPSSNRA